MQESEIVFFGFFFGGVSLLWGFFRLVRWIRYRK